jgi:hypothetical protein
MKIKTVEAKKVFVPVTIELTIESEEELKFFWHMSNSSVKKIKEGMCSTVSDFDIDDIVDAQLLFFKTLDQIAIQRGLTN